MQNVSQCQHQAHPGPKPLCQQRHLGHGTEQQRPAGGALRRGEDPGLCDSQPAPRPGQPDCGGHQGEPPQALREVPGGAGLHSDAPGFHRRGPHPLGLQPPGLHPGVPGRGDQPGRRFLQRAGREKGGPGHLPLQ